MNQDDYFSSLFQQSGAAHQSVLGTYLSFPHQASSAGPMCTAASSTIGETQSVSRKMFNEPKKEKSLFTEMARDIKGFLLEYRGVLYFLAAALIIDELVFKGAFRHRLQGVADKVIAKVEEKVS
jgi:hypothetical protein